MATNKKAKKAEKKSEPKNRSYVHDMLKRDMESCAGKDAQDAKLGKAKPRRDIFKDDPCYGCRFAMENKDANGPFDRRFKCYGITRILEQIGAAATIIKELGQHLPSDSYGSKTYMSSADRNRKMLEAQGNILSAGQLISLSVRNDLLDCREPNGNIPSCYFSAINEVMAKGLKR